MIILNNLIYPATFDLVIQQGMSGYFIVRDKEHISALETVKIDGKCASRKVQSVAEHLDLTLLVETQVQVISPSYEHMLKLLQNSQHIVQSSVDLYHKCAKRRIDEALPAGLTDHIVLCTFI